LQFFFSSRRRHTISKRDWSSDVCSSDLGTKIEANANKFTFVWRKSTERYHSNLVEKSNQMYDELLEKEIIPEIERENEEELSVKEIETIVEKLNDTIDTYTKKIDDS